MIRAAFPMLHNRLRLETSLELSVMPDQDVSGGLKCSGFGTVIYQILAAVKRKMGWE
jgi:hypothetical protein